jgi:hypothetical protein
MQENASQQIVGPAHYGVACNPAVGIACMSRLYSKRDVAFHLEKIWIGPKTGLPCQSCFSWSDVAIQGEKQGV